MSGLWWMGGGVFAARGDGGGSTGRCGWWRSCGGRRRRQQIQLHMVYAPEPPFDAGTVERAPAAVVAAARADLAAITARREVTARAVAARLGVVV